LISNIINHSKNKKIYLFNYPIKIGILKKKQLALVNKQKYKMNENILFDKKEKNNSQINSENNEIDEIKILNYEEKQEIEKDFNKIKRKIKKIFEEPKEEKKNILIIYLKRFLLIVKKIFLFLCFFLVIIIKYLIYFSSYLFIMFKFLVIHFSLLAFILIPFFYTFSIFNSILVFLKIIFVDRKMFIKNNLQYIFLCLVFLVFPSSISKIFFN
jgi:hypothetical protein